ncbi:MAG: hypothetical protein WD060_00705, partial [Pirellulales bacterium]
GVVDQWGEPAGIGHQCVPGSVAARVMSGGSSGNVRSGCQWSGSIVISPCEVVVCGHGSGRRSGEVR